MTRQEITNRIGAVYLTANIEEDEYSYVKEAGSKAALEKKVGHSVNHYKLDRRFEYNDATGKYVILVETKQNFIDDDEKQLAAYLEEERALHKGRKIICILANTNNDKIKVWKSEINEKHLLPEETTIDDMMHYVRLFVSERQNDRETVMKNTYALNELLHKKSIEEELRSQFIGTCLLYVKKQVELFGNGEYIGESMRTKLCDIWATKSPSGIMGEIKEVLRGLLDGSTNKAKKIELLQRKVLENQHVIELSLSEWIEILSTVMINIYKYIDEDSSEGQDILNLFFITFNKYTGKADKNQAFTPDHIADFMCRLTEVNMNTRVLDECCGSGSFLVQAMVKELADCRNGHTEAEYKKLADNVKRNNIYGIECEEKAYGLATTNMLIHGDGNSNVEFGSCFDKRNFIKKARPNVILMNPPYNALPKNIPTDYKVTWSKTEKDGKEDPTKGLVFIKYLSDIAKEERWIGTKLAVLLPMSAAIGTSKRITEMKNDLLKDNTLEAVFSLPTEIFYPGASVQACCMYFTLNQPHFNVNGIPNKKTFFGYYKEDGFKKKKNLGRIEQFDSNGQSKWKAIEEQWLDLYRNKTIKAGMSAMQSVTGNDEWLCEAYMKTDYSKLTEADFQRTINDYLAYLVKTSVKSSCIPLETDKWGEFRIGDLFNIRRGDRIIHNEDYFDVQNDEYRYPVITTTTANNAVDGFYNKMNCEGNCIVSGGEANGMFTTYQADPFWGLDTVRIYEPKDFEINKNIGLFLATIITLNMYRFSYGRKAKPGNMYSLNILLPIDKNKNPDWVWMENYIKSLPFSDKII